MPNGLTKLVASESANANGNGKVFAAIVHNFDLNAIGDSFDLRNHVIDKAALTAGSWESVTNSFKTALFYQSHFDQTEKLPLSVVDTDWGIFSKPGERFHQIKLLTPPPVSAKVMENLVQIPRTGRFAIEHPWLAMMARASHAAPLKWFAKAAHALPVIGAVVVLSSIASAASNTTRAYTQDGNRIGSRTRRAISDGVVDVADNYNPDISGATRDVAKSFLRNKILLLEKSKVFAG
jgi:hypothetical protein